MTVLLHPRKDAPERYRVWDRETRTQKYFPLTKAGKKAAEEFDKKVAEIKRMRALSKDLSINKLFNEDGLIKGMSRKFRQRNGASSYEFFALYANHKQTELSIDKRGFDKAYELATQWLMDQYEIESTAEIRQKFKKARRHYWESVAKPQALIAD